MNSNTNFTAMPKLPRYNLEQAIKNTFNNLDNVSVPTYRLSHLEAVYAEFNKNASGKNDHKNYLTIFLSAVQNLIQKLFRFLKLRSF